MIADGTTAAFSASSAGPIVYRMGSEEAGKQLIWFDRSGKEMERVGSPDIANLWMWSLSPDGRRVAINRTVKGDFDVWLLEARRGLLTRFTVDPGFDWAGVWSPDSAGSHISTTIGSTKGPSRVLQELKRHCCHRRRSMRQRTGRSTGAIWCFRGQVRRRVWISGPYLIFAIPSKAG